MPQPRRFTVKDGPVTIPIYPTPSGKYLSWTVVYKFEGRRIRRKLKTRELAIEHATQQARAIANGRASGLALTYDQTADYLAARKVLGPGLTLSEVARDYRRRNPVSGGTRTVVESVSDYIAHMTAKKRRRPINADHLRNVTLRLEAFATAFSIPLHTLTGTAVQSWIDKLDVSLRTQNNYLADVRALIRFAIARKWLIKEFDELSGVELERAGPGKIHTYTPEEAAQILRHAEKHSPEWLPYLPVRMFSGIRAAEVARLRPGHFHLDTKWIACDAEITKTNFRRLMPIQPNLGAWLKEYPPGEKLAPIEGAKGLAKVIRIIRKAGVSNRNNGFRDSYASYRLAAVQDAANVAEETGHDVDQLRGSYREISMPDGRVITPEQAEKYFTIFPTCYAAD